MCDAHIDDPFGSTNRMPFDVEDLCVHGVVGPRKCLVQPESTMARVLGTKVRGAVVFANFSLYLVSIHSQLDLFLFEPPFFVGFCCSLVMPGSRFSAVTARVFQRVAMVQAVVPIFGDGWPCTVICVEIG